MNTTIEPDMDPVDIKTQFKNFLKENLSTLQEEAKKCTNLGNLETFLLDAVTNFENNKQLTKPEENDKSASEEIVQWFKYPMDNYKLVYDACFTLEEKKIFKRINTKDNVKTGFSLALVILLEIATTLLISAMPGGVFICLYALAEGVYTALPIGLIDSAKKNTDFITKLNEIMKGGMRGGELDDLVIFTEKDVEELKKIALANGGQVIGSAKPLSSLSQEELGNAIHYLSDETSDETLKTVRENVIKELTKKTVDHILTTALSNIKNRALLGNTIIQHGGKRNNKGRTKRKSKNKRKNKSKTKRK